MKMSEATGAEAQIADAFLTPYLAPVYILLVETAVPPESQPMYKYYV